MISLNWTFLILLLPGPHLQEVCSSQAIKPLHPHTATAGQVHSVLDSLTPKNKSKKKKKKKKKKKNRQQHHITTPL
jgi:uncharacterized metal-binding protein